MKPKPCTGAEGMTGLPMPEMDKPKNRYAEPQGPPPDNFHEEACGHEMDNPGDFSKKFPTGR